MHYRAISNAVQCSYFQVFRCERGMFTVLTAKKKDGLTLHALFNLCPKIKKVLNNMAIQLVIEESPVCVVRFVRTNRTFHLQSRFPLRLRG